MECEADDFAQMSRELLAIEHEQPTLDKIVEWAMELVPAADHVGISLRLEKGRIDTAAASSPLVELADQLQYDLGEGPCLDSARVADTYLASDTRTDKRWPRWGPLVAEKGLLSVLSVQLVQHDGQPLGAVNLYAEKPDVYTRDDLDCAQVMAHHAAGALETAREMEGLRAAMHSRHVIGVAQGMLMQRYGLSMDRAFDVLLRQSQDSNTKLRDVAAAMVNSGSIAEVRDEHHEPSKDHSKEHSVAFGAGSSGQ